MIAGLLRGLLDLGVEPQTDSRAVELLATDGGSPASESSAATTPSTSGPAAGDPANGGF